MAKESSAHAPEIPQRKLMGEGLGVMKGDDFGVGDIPGTSRIKGDREMMGKTLSESERATGPAMKRGEGMMRATRAPDHGPHHHRA